MIIINDFYEFLISVLIIQNIYTVLVQISSTNNQDQCFVISFKYLLILCA